MVSLADRLKALGVRTGAADLPVSPPASPYDIGSVVAGEILPTEVGETFVYEERYAPDYRQGRAAIRPESPLRVIAGPGTGKTFSLF